MADRDRGRSAPVHDVAAPSHDGAAPPSGPVVAAAIVLVAAVSTTVAGAVLLVAAAVDPSSVPLPLISGALALGTTAALLLRRRIEVVGAVCATAAVGCGLTVLVAGLDLVAGPDLVAGGASMVVGTAWMPGSLIVVSVLGIRLVSPRRRLFHAGTLASVLLWATTVADLLLDGGSGGAVTIAAAVWVAMAVAGGVALVHAWWVGRGSVRDAAGWLALAQWAVLLAAVPSYAGVTGIADAAAGAAATILPAAVILLAAVLLLTGLTSDGAPVDVSLARVIFWVLLGMSLIVGFAAIATTVAEMAPVTPTTAGMFAVAGLALAIEPARRWVQRAVDQLAYGRSAEPQALLRALGEQLANLTGETGASSDQVMGGVARALRDSLRLVSVEIASARHDRVVATAGSGAPTGRVVQIPLPGPEGPAGTLTVSGAARDGVDRRTRRVLHAISGVLALAVRLADVNHEIDRARAQVLDMAANEQRLVRSELEDGVGPGVRSARQGVVRAGELAAQDSGEAQRLLSGAAQSLSDVTREVRDLARTLLPGSLDAGDAAGALAALATRFDRPAIAIDLVAIEDAATDGDGSAEVADATGLALAYHLLAEAVLGARRDPGVQAIRVVVTAGVAETRIEARFEGESAAAARAGVRLAERGRDAGATVCPVPPESAAVTVDLAVPS